MQPSMKKVFRRTKGEKFKDVSIKYINKLKQHNTKTKEETKRKAFDELYPARLDSKEREIYIIKAMDLSHIRCIKDENGKILTQSERF